MFDGMNLGGVHNWFFIWCGHPQVIGCQCLCPNRIPAGYIYSGQKV